MAWNNGFPATYGQMFPQGYPMMQPNYGQYQAQQQPTQMQGTNQQMMTPPTIRAEIVQVDNEAAASSFPVGAGASQMMIAKDDSAIFIKSAMANGQTTLDVYEKRAPEPPTPPFDPGEYVRKDEIEALVNAAIQNATAASRRAAKKEVE